MTVRDAAPSRAAVAKVSAPLEVELEALFREVRRDASLAVLTAATPEAALEAARGLMDRPLEVEP